MISNLVITLKSYYMGDFWGYWSNELPTAKTAGFKEQIIIFSVGDSHPQSTDSKLGTKSSTPIYYVYCVSDVQYVEVKPSITSILSIDSRLFAAKLQQESIMERRLGIK
jgi:hypothetical protein